MTLRSVSERAEELEKRYEWLGAVKLYKESLSAFTEQDRATVQERIACCVYRSAFQAESPERFMDAMKDASAEYERAASLYREIADARVSHCESMSEFAKFWVAKDTNEKIRRLDRSIGSDRAFLDMIRQSGKSDLVAEPCISLLDQLFQRLDVESNPESRAKLVQAAVEVSEFALKSVDPSAIGKLSLLYALSIPHYYLASQILPEGEKRDRCRKLAVAYPKKALELAQGQADSFTLGVAHHWTQVVKEAMEGDIDASISHSLKAVEHFTATADSYWIGLAAGYGTFVMGHWGTFAEVDPESRLRKAAECERYAQVAVSHGERIGNEFVLALVYYGLGEFYNAKGTYSLSEESEKIGAFQRALEANQRGVEYAKLSGSISAMANALHSLSKTYQFMGVIQHDTEQKIRLLELALRYREESLIVLEKLTPHNDWDLGILGNYKTMIKSEIARIEPNSQAKIKILTEAAADAEKCIEYFKRSYPVTSEASPRFLSVYSWHSSNLGRILKQRYELDRDPKTLEKLASAFRFSASIAIKAKRHSLAAEFHWEIAKAYDSAGEFLKASSEFKEGAASYSGAIEEIPALKELYGDLSNYLAAWSDVEEARNHHENEGYHEASGSYGRAAEHLKQTTRLVPLSTHYLACSSLEEAEAESRNERPESAYDSFSKASSLFGEAKNQLEAHLLRASSAEERDEGTKWLRITRARERYAIGRATLEEGRILEKKGEKLSSSRKFAAAAAILEDLAEEEESEVGRREVGSLALFCRAWQKMKAADVEGSPELYAQAAELFVRAKEVAPRERHGLLALGNASYCRALELGSKFRVTHDINLYSVAKQQLETAAEYYTEGDFENASSWTRATQRMFDALIYLSTAETELDPEKKTRLYHLAERNLEHAAKLYHQAGYPAKKDEALRHLKRTREEKELLLTPMEILKETPILSSSSNISSPSLTRDKPLGLERFEHANIEANLIVRDTQMKVGERLEYEVEIVNAGRGAAVLVKMEKILPEGFVPEFKAEKYRLEDNYLNLRGRRLDSLKTEEVALTLKAMKKGEFLLRPRILYLDEEGKYRYYEPEAVKLTVSELGITGWLKGPGK